MKSYKDFSGLKPRRNYSCTAVCLRSLGSQFFKGQADLPPSQCRIFHSGFDFVSLKKAKTTFVPIDSFLRPFSICARIVLILRVYTDHTTNYAAARCQVSDLSNVGRPWQSCCPQVVCSALKRLCFLCRRCCGGGLSWGWVWAWWCSWNAFRGTCRKWSGLREQLRLPRLLERALLWINPLGLR